jgi:lipoprotein-anchoring transpeptidase ErfK/SrfK
MKLLVPLHLESAGIAYCPLPGNISRDVDLLIGLKEQALGRYEKGILQAWYPIASGKEGYATPTGSFRILQKERVYRSRTYPKPDGGALMPHAMRFYKGYWIHGGALPGKPASHGCIRLMPADAQVLYKQSQKGDLILIKKKLGP